MDTRQQDAGQMITALRDGLHGLHVARMALVAEARALRLAGRKAEREKVWARVEEITAQIEVSTKELAEHMLRADQTQRRGDAETRTANLPDAREAVSGQEAEMPLLRDPAAEMPDDEADVVVVLRANDEGRGVTTGAHHAGHGWCETQDGQARGLIIRSDMIEGWCHHHEAAEALRKAVRP